ncbi:MAG: hypothetical protein AAF447_18530 [Myxococcota bacterium]
MDALFLTLFVSAGLVALGVLLFAFTVRARSFDQADQLALLPLRDDAGSAPADAGPASPLRDGDQGPGAEG